MITSAVGAPIFGNKSNIAAVAEHANWSNAYDPMRTITSFSNRNIPVFFPRRWKRYCVFGIATAHYYWHRRELLRALYRQQRLHARLRADYSVGLHRLQYHGRKLRGARLDEKISQS